MAARNDAKVKAALNRSMLTVPDGMGTVWFLRLLGHKAGRVYGPDLMLEAAQQGWRHFFLGGEPDAIDRMIARLQKHAPGLAVAGAYCPPFEEMSSEDWETAFDHINSSRADVVWVALGSPRQELWMAQNRGKLDAPLLVGVGAAFDFLSGTKPQAPVWMQRGGLEWLFRLASEPKRLWRRYASYPLFVMLALGQVLGLTRYPMEEAK
jgi:N-acetylglucosaminyldiphosphoundecaprenol N-acetyl-beta-D-mannosaminyltransferase